MEWGQLVHTVEVTVSTTSAKCSNSMHYIPVYLEMIKHLSNIVFGMTECYNGTIAKVQK